MHVFSRLIGGSLGNLTLRIAVLNLKLQDKIGTELERSSFWFPAYFNAWRSNKEHTRNWKKSWIGLTTKGPTEIFETFHSYKSSFNLVISINIITCFPFRPYSELQNLVPFHVFHMIPLMLIPDALGTHKSWTLPTWRDARDARDVADGAHHRGWRPRRHRTARRVCSRSTAPTSRASTRRWRRTGACWGIGRQGQGRQAGVAVSKCFGDGSNYHKWAIS